MQEAQSVDVDKAVASARDAFKIGSEWRSMDASARGQLLIKFATLLKRDREYLSVNEFCEKNQFISIILNLKIFKKLESLDNGKHIDESIFDIDFAIKTVEYFAGWSDKVI